MILILILILVLPTQSFDIVLCLFFFAHDSFFYFIKCYLGPQLAFREAPVQGDGLNPLLF